MAAMCQEVLGAQEQCWEHPDTSPASEADVPGWVVLGSYTAPPIWGFHREQLLSLEQGSSLVGDRQSTALYW